MCARSGVREIKFGKLSLIFGEKDKSLNSSLEVVQTIPNEQESEKITEEAAQKDMREAAIEYLEELQLTDPLAYEKLLGGDLDGGSTS